MLGNVGDGTLAIDAWNTETAQGESTSGFDCAANAELHRYYLREEPIPVLLLIDKQARYNQELENAYLISYSRMAGTNYEHYGYELRPDHE
jgi:hypothetical protein